MQEKIVSAIYVLFGLINIIASTLSTSIPIHMVILGMICFVTGFALWMKRAWSILLIVFAGSVTLTLGLITLYSSIKLVGFSSSSEILLYNIYLLSYSVVALSVFIYTIANRSKLLEP